MRTVREVPKSTGTMLVKVHDDDTRGVIKSIVRRTLADGQPIGRGSRSSLLTAISMALGLLAPDVANAAGEPYSIVNYYAGMVVDVWQAQIVNTYTVLWPDWGGANQRFDRVPVDPNNPRSDFLIKARHAAKCLDVSGASGADGAIVQTFDCH